MKKVFVYIDRGSERGYLLGLKKGTPIHEVKDLLESDKDDSMEGLLRNAHSMSWVAQKHKTTVSKAAHFVVGKDYTIQRLA